MPNASGRGCDVDEAVAAVLAGRRPWAVAEGDARAVLAGWPAGVVQAVCTSPPYFGLRNYKTPPLVWGGDPGHAHVWGAESITEVRDNLNHDFNARWGHEPGQK